VKYLIDTHLLVWWLNDDVRLPAKARNIIADSDHDIAVSIASVWEIAIKHALGRLDIPDAFIPSIPT
jgi:PIN domain nuclease of toxin-antitoxin system